MYDLLIKASWQTIDSFARRDPKLKGSPSGAGTSECER
jgi:hypothetical protein